MTLTWASVKELERFKKFDAKLQKQSYNNFYSVFIIDNYPHVKLTFVAQYLIKMC